jgi:adenine-specific DNA glycosylase
LNKGVDHVFTHFRLHLTIEEAVIPHNQPLPEHYRWVDRASLGQHALPTVMRKVAKTAGLI